MLYTVGVQIVEVITVFNYSVEPPTRVTGLVNGDFSRILFEDGVISDRTIVVTEIDSGLAPGDYKVVYTPDTAASHRGHVWSATYDVEGWDWTHRVVAADISENIYQAKAIIFDDNAAGADRYAITWFKNGQPITSGITSPTIKVKRLADATDLIPTAAMTPASDGDLIYNEPTNRISGGASYMIIATATIDGASRTWHQPVGRDST